MLSVQENEALTQVGPGTPMGNLLRRYWHPIAAVAELDESPTKEVRLMGEDLVLYRDRKGRHGLIGRYCAHRRVNLAYGIPEDDGLRCMYHGWVFDCTGQCTEQPFEETVHPEGRFKGKVSLPAYPVEELAGLLWAYLGPAPAPLLPRWAPLAWDNVVRDIAISVLPCSWLQCMENSVDPLHAEWLHSYMTEYIKERRGQVAQMFPTQLRHQKIGFDVFPYGVIKRRVVEGQTEEDSDWRIGHPVLFPNILLVTGAVESWMDLQYRVPIDDTHTLHITSYVYRPAPGQTAPAQERVPYRNVPLLDEAGQFPLEHALDQDKMAWMVQGPVAQREHERLGESDRGVILFRKLLREQMSIVEDGGDPIATVRDPEQNECIELPTEDDPFKHDTKKVVRHVPIEAGKSPAQDLIDRVLETWQRA